MTNRTINKSYSWNIRHGHSRTLKILFVAQAIASWSFCLTCKPTARPSRENHRVNDAIVIHMKKIPHSQMKACESCARWKQKRRFSWRKRQCPNKQGAVLPEETYLSSPGARRGDKRRTRLPSTPGMCGSLSLSACSQKLLMHQDSSQTSLMAEIYLIVRCEPLFCSSTLLGFSPYLCFWPCSKAAPWTSSSRPGYAEQQRSVKPYVILLHRRTSLTFLAKGASAHFFASWGAGLFQDSCTTSTLPLLSSACSALPSVRLDALWFLSLLLECGFHSLSGYAVFMGFFLVSGNHLHIIPAVYSWYKWLQKYGCFLHSFIPSFKNNLISTPT